MPRSSASVPPHPPEDPPHGLGWNAYAVLTPPPDPAVERRRRRGLVLRISTVLAGVLQLALAGFLITLPGGSTTLDPLPGSERDRRPEAVRVPMAAATPRPAASSARPSAPTAPAAPTTRPTSSPYGWTSRPSPATSPTTVPTGTGPTGTGPTTTADSGSTTVSPAGPASTNAPGASAPPATRRPGPARKRGYVPPEPALSPAPRIVSTLAPLVRQPRPRATRTTLPGSVPGSASDQTGY